MLTRSALGDSEGDLWQAVTILTPKKGCSRVPAEFTNIPVPPWPSSQPSSSLQTGAQQSQHCGRADPWDFPFPMAALGIWRPRHCSHPQVLRVLSGFLFPLCRNLTYFKLPQSCLSSTICWRKTDFLPLPSQSTFAPFLGVILAVLRATSFLECRTLSRSHYSAALTGSVLHLEKQLTS